ncbi:MAG: hypothetical protein DME96_00610 [Verrucomicrobia bacterium]|nr:MAG: hypothetical protein DME93_03590 [Verrucomicrobiota bacterium]PYJ18747.1 MAG: hypothetical protein DME96_00610 [Verrucomicrobiota bacterium]
MPGISIIRKISSVKIRAALAKSNNYDVIVFEPLLAKGRRPFLERKLRLAAWRWLEPKPKHSV